MNENTLWLIAGAAIGGYLIGFCSAVLAMLRMAAEAEPDEHANLDRPA